MDENLYIPFTWLYRIGGKVLEPQVKQNPSV